MGWMISVAMLLIGCFSGNDILVVTSGLFAIAGSLGGAANIIKDAIKQNEKKPSVNNTGYDFLD